MNAKSIPLLTSLLILLAFVSGCKTKEKIVLNDVAHRYADSVRYVDSVRVYEYTNDTTHFFIEERIKYRDRTLHDTITVKNETSEKVVREVIPQWVFAVVAGCSLLCILAGVLLFLKK